MCTVLGQVKHLHYPGPMLLPGFFIRTISQGHENFRIAWYAAGDRQVPAVLQERPIHQPLNTLETTDPESPEFPFVPWLIYRTFLSARSSGRLSRQITLPAVALPAER